MTAIRKAICVSVLLAAAVTPLARSGDAYSYRSGAPGAIAATAAPSSLGAEVCTGMMDKVRIDCGAVPGLKQSRAGLMARNAIPEPDLLGMFGAALLCVWLMVGWRSRRVQEL